MMPRVDVERETAHLSNPFSRSQARVGWEFHNTIWYDHTFRGDLQRMWDRWRSRWAKPS